MSRKQVYLFVAAGALVLSSSAIARAQYPVYGNYFGQPGAQANRIYQHFGNQGARVFGYYHNMGARAYGWNGSQPRPYYYPNYRHRNYRRW